MTNLDKNWYARMTRNMSGDEKYLIRPYYMKVNNVTCKLVEDLEGKLCFSWKSPDVSYEVYKTSPIVSIEKLENGYKIITYCGMIYLLEET